MKMNDLIVVVDDHPDLRYWVCRVLQDAGYLVVPHDGGASALAWLRGHERPALVLTDMNMVGMDGDDLIRAIREDQRLASTPIVAISADPSAGPAARESGSSAFLHRPCEADVLLRVVRETITQHRTAVAELVVASMIGEINQHRQNHGRSPLEGDGRTRIASILTNAGRGDDAERVLAALLDLLNVIEGDES